MGLVSKVAPLAPGATAAKAPNMAWVKVTRDVGAGIVDLDVWRLKDQSEYWVERVDVPRGTSGFVADGPKQGYSWIWIEAVEPKRGTSGAVDAKGSWMLIPSDAVKAAKVGR